MEMTKTPRWLYDPKSYELAEHFLPTKASDRLKDELAHHIQEAVEDWLAAERDRLAPSVASGQPGKEVP